MAILHIFRKNLINTFVIKTIQNVIIKKKKRNHLYNTYTLEKINTEYIVYVIFKYKKSLSFNRKASCNFM